MINDITDLNREVFLATRDEHWDDNRIVYLSKLLRVYWDAKVEAEQYGYVGVGCISYAEDSMRHWQGENPYETYEE